MGEVPVLINKLDALKNVFYEGSYFKPDYGITKALAVRERFFNKYGSVADVNEFFDYQCAVAQGVFRGCGLDDKAIKFVDVADRLYQETLNPWDNRPTNLLRNIFKENASMSPVSNVFNSLQTELLCERDIYLIGKDLQEEKQSKKQFAKMILENNKNGYEFSALHSNNRYLVFSKNYQNSSVMLKLNLTGLSRNSKGVQLGTGNVWPEACFTVHFDLEFTFEKNQKNHTKVSLSPVKFFMLDLYGVPSFFDKCRDFRDFGYVMEMNLMLLEKIDSVIES